MSLECENGHDSGDAALSSEISSGNSPKTSSDRALLPPSWPGAVTNPAAPGTRPSPTASPGCAWHRPHPAFFLPHRSAGRWGLPADRGGSPSLGAVKDSYTDVPEKT